MIIAHWEYPGHLLLGHQPSPGPVWSLMQQVPVMLPRAHFTDEDTDPTRVVLGTSARHLLLRRLPVPPRPMDGMISGVSFFHRFFGGLDCTPPLPWS